MYYNESFRLFLQKEKKDKDRLSIVKRLTKSKKSKSPPPDAEASTSDVSSGHQR